MPGKKEKFLFIYFEYLIEFNFYVKIQSFIHTRRES
jgi:hypothetical protein